jgi:Flp pilus assembly secretin CpaC
MRRAIALFALVLAATLVAETAIAAAGGLAVELNRSRRVVLTGTPANISIADPAIADVAIIDTHSIVVIGKSFGVTDIVVSDHAGRLLMNSSVAVVPPEEERVTVYRGTEGTEYSCIGRCGSSGSVAGSAASGASGASAAGSPGSQPSNAAGIAQSPVTVTTAAAYGHGPQ